MKQQFNIAGRLVGEHTPVFIIAELSANHHQDYSKAEELIHIAKECGADAVKLQTYTPDTITINCRNEYFQIGEGTLWAGKNLHDLYGEAYTPWEWHHKLKEVAEAAGLILFSTPFDFTSVDFLEDLDVPAYKIASFELVDHPLIEKVVDTGKPIIMSTGMGTVEEIQSALNMIQSTGGEELILLKCTSAYPSLPEDMNLITIPDMVARFNVPIGLSDHTKGTTVPVAATTLGACVIEKHLTQSRSVEGPDSAFSLEPDEFKQMVTSVRTAEKCIGQAAYQLSEKEVASREFRKSLFIVKDLNKGEMFTEENVRSIRPGYGLSPSRYKDVLGRKAACDLKFGTPLKEKHLAE
ncbi:MAG: pseudaminic acid synthase [Verrucomicrobiota bacterium]